MSIGERGRREGREGGRGGVALDKHLQGFRGLLAPPPPLEAKARKSTNPPKGT